MKQIKRTRMYKAIIHRGWKVFGKPGSLLAKKEGIRVTARTISDLRFFIRFEKFYKGKY